MKKMSQKANDKKKTDKNMMSQKANDKKMIKI